jgi:hypothetical protein
VKENVIREGKEMDQMMIQKDRNDLARESQKKELLK